MDGKIGYYIHLTSQGYENYGTNEQSGSNDISQAINQQHHYITEQIALLKQKDGFDEAINELKKRLSNKLFDESEIVKAEMAAKTQIGKLSELVQDKILKEVDYSVFRKIGIGKKEVLKNLSASPGLVENLEEARHRRDLLRDNLKIINEKGKTGKVSLSTINALNRNIEEFFKACNVGHLTGGSKIFSQDMSIAKLHSLEGAMSTLLNAIPLYKAEQSTINGIFGEKMVAMVGEEGLALGKNACLEELKKYGIIKGGNTIKFSIDSSNINNNINKYYQEETGNSLARVYSSQNKVDVSITIKLPEKNEAKIDASVKAYSVKGQIMSVHLQDVELIRALTATKGNFANHWLNIHSIENYSKNNKMEEVLQKTIEFEALVHGSMLKKFVENANAFVAIDVSSNKVFAMSTYDIFSNMETGDNNGIYFLINPKLYSSSLNFYKENSRINSNGDKTLEDEKAIRIANVIKAVHSIPVSVRMNIKMSNFT